VSAAFFFVGLFMGIRTLMIIGVLYFLSDAVFEQWKLYRKRGVYEGWVRSQRQKELDEDSEKIPPEASENSTVSGRQFPPETPKR